MVTRACRRTLYDGQVPDMITPFTLVRDKVSTLLRDNPQLPMGSMITQTENTEDGLVVYADNLETGDDKRHFVITITEVPGW